MTHDVLIIGAGMAGLQAAEVLAAADKKVVILDKGRGVGGRMATRRLGELRFDHGAQFFTARDETFQRAIEQWRAENTAGLWCKGFPAAEAPKKSPDGHARYAGHNGMTAIPKAIAANHDVRTSRKVVKAEIADREPDGKQWLVTAHDENRFEDSALEEFRAKALLVTAPAEQALALVDTGNAILSADDRTDLEEIAYDPCFAVMALFSGPSKIPPPGAISFRPEGEDESAEGEPIAWIADNGIKALALAGRPDEIPGFAAITIHAGPKYTRTNYDKPREEVGAELLAAAKQWLPDYEPEKVQVQRWRYSKPYSLHPERYLMAAGLTAPLVFAGDGFGGAKVEGAFLSGRAAGQKLAELI